MSIVPQLERELIEAARRAGAAAPAPSSARQRRPGRPGRRTLVATILVAALVLAAAALAASGLLASGSPVVLPPGTPLTPAAGLGVPVPASVDLLAPRVADPGGGPPWAMRYVATTRGVACLQFGRFVRGQIGVIGQDGAFANDKRFHPLASDYLSETPFPCGALDARGHAFASAAIYGTPASALFSGQGCTPVGRRLPARRFARDQQCPAADERLVIAGLAGPLAQSVTYRYAGRSQTIATSGPDGAYLIVIAASAFGPEAGEFMPSADPVLPPIVRIRYRDGTTCRPLVRRGCPPHGQAQPRNHLSARAVATPIAVRVGHAHHQPALLISWTARVAVTRASAGYTISTNFPGVEPHCGFTTIGPVLTDARKGQRVHYTLPTNGCHGRFRITISYAQGQTFPVPASPQLPSVLVGRRTVTVR